MIKPDASEETFCMMMNFYNAPKEVDLTNKTEVVHLALAKKCFLNEFCKFLVVIWKTDKEDKGRYSV